MTTKRNVVDDEKIGQLARRQHDLFRRVREGAVPLDFALMKLQEAIEGVGLVKEYQLKIGQHLNSKSLIRMVEKADFYVGGAAQALVESAKFNQLLSRRTISLKVRLITPRSLGFVRKIQLEELYEAARNQGYTLCPPEVGPYFRLIYRHTGNETVFMATQPIVMNGGQSTILTVTNESGQGDKLSTAAFSSIFGSPQIDPDSKWVFALN